MWQIPNKLLIRHGRRYGWGCFCQKKNGRGRFCCIRKLVCCQRSYFPILNSMKHVPSGRIGWSARLNKSKTMSTCETSDSWLYTSHQAARLRSSVEVRVWSSPVGNDSEYSRAYVCVYVCLLIASWNFHPISRYIVFNNMFHSLR